jgi:hypothetical protein
MDEIKRTLNELYVKLYAGDKGTYACLGQYIGNPEFIRKQRARFAPTFGPTSRANKPQSRKRSADTR